MKHSAETAPLLALGPPPQEAETAALLARLPDWFGRPEVNAAYARSAAHLPAVTLRTGGRLVGLASLEPVTAATLDIHLMAVDPAFHRMGLGRELVAAAAAEGWRRGARLLSVETVGPLTDCPFYARTRAFYAAQGFHPLCEEADAWGDGVSRLILVRPL